MEKVMELSEKVEVGDVQSYVLWGVQDAGATFKFESGLVLLKDAIEDA